MKQILAAQEEDNEEKVEETVDESNIPLYNNSCYFSPLIHNYQFKVMILGDKKGKFILSNNNNIQHNFNISRKV